MLTKLELEAERKRIAPLVVVLAELLVQTHGPSGYGERLTEMLEGAGAPFGASPRTIRDWLQRRTGWRKRYERAVEAYELNRSGLDPNHPELRAMERRLKENAELTSRYKAQLDAADTTRNAFEQMSEALEAIVEPLKLVPLAKRKIDPSAHPVDLVTALSDQHADQVIHGPASWGQERYNFDVFCLRLERWTRLLIDYATLHLPSHRVERLHVFSLGDAVHGDIHNAKYRNHFGNTMRAAVAVADAQSEALAQLLEHIPYVSLVGVNGNHPRTTTRKDFADPHDNFDFLVLALMAARLHNYVAAGRLDIHAPKAWTAFVEVRGKIMALNHGDDVRGTWGIPWYGFSKKEARTQAITARAEARVDFFWYGHYHTDVAVTESGSRGIHTGAFTLTDPFALNALSAGGEPMQSAMLVGDLPGMRSRLLDIPLWVRNEAAEEAYWQGKHTPTFGRVGALHLLGQSDVVSTGGKFPVIRARK